jgi:hypothetical protein
MSVTFSGAWQAGTGRRQELWADPTWEGFAARYKELDARGLRLVAVRTYAEGGRRWWVGAFREGTGRQELWADPTWEGFTDKYKVFDARGLRLAAIDTYVEDGMLWWLGAFREATGRQQLWADPTWDGFIDKYRAFDARGLRLVGVHTYVEDGQLWWLGAFREGTGRQELWADPTWDGFTARYKEFDACGLRLASVHTYAEGGRRWWVGAFREETGRQELWSDPCWEGFAAKYKELDEQGLRLIGLDVAGAAAPFTVVLHPRILCWPTNDLETMLANLRQVYATANIAVDVRPRRVLDLPGFLDLPVGACLTDLPTPEQELLFGLREGVGPNEVVAYFVHATRPPLNGCATHPAGRPGAVIARDASVWSLAHEVGHVLGLDHVNDSHHLMTGNGTDNIVNPPPILDAREAITMRASPYVIKN